MSVAFRTPAPALRAASRAPSTLWVHGPVWDGIWMLSALWLAPLVLVLAQGRDDPSTGPLDVLYFALTALFWIGHRLSSAWLAYGTEAYRPLLRAQPVRFIVLPLVIVAACFAVFLPPDGALPWTRVQRLIAAAILDYGFVTYHFGAQHFGALSLYRIRTASAASALMRRRDRLFALGVGGVLIFVADLLAGSIAYQSLWIGAWLPDWIVAAQEQIRAGALAVLLVSTAMMLFAELRAAPRSLPRLLYIVGLAVMAAVALQPRGLFPFLVLWTAQHWIVAVGLASRTPSSEPAPQSRWPRRALHGLNNRPYALVVLFMIVSVLALPLFEVEANRQGGTFYGDRIFGLFASGLRTSALVPALVAMGFASGFLHYLLDRGVYRMSDPLVRNAAKGLVAPR